jgi:hypothetical protein
LASQIRVLNHARYVGNHVPKLPSNSYSLAMLYNPYLFSVPRQLHHGPCLQIFLFSSHPLFSVSVSAAPQATISCAINNTNHVTLNTFDVLLSESSDKSKRNERRSRNNKESTVLGTDETMPMRGMQQQQSSAAQRMHGPIRPPAARYCKASATVAFQYRVRKCPVARDTACTKRFIPLATVVRHS